MGFEIENGILKKYTGEETVLIIPDGVTSIGYMAFKDYTALAEIIIPNSVTNIGNSAFYGCTALTKITIPKSVTRINSNAFKSCSGLLQFTIPEGVKSIERNTFRDCTSLRQITIPNTVENIDYGAFSKCLSLSDITIPNSVKSIGDWAFSNCITLTDIVIPNSVKSIGTGAFSACVGLKQIKALEASYIGNSFADESESVICPKIPFPARGTAILKMQYALGYLASPKLYSDKVATDCKKYLNGQRKRILTLSIEKGWLDSIQYYMSNKLISADMIKELFEIAQRNKNTEVIADDAFNGCKNITISAPQDSCAAIYAKNNSIPLNIT